jgi:GT2 family glycosyltransferase
VNRVAIIIVNWNGLQDTLDCLGALEMQTYRDRVTIVVDNGSRADASVIGTRYPDVVLLRNRENLGFCGGNNVGIQKAAELGAEYCWILNNDTEMAADCLFHLVDMLDNDTTLGAVAHPIIYFEDPSLYWFAGGTLEAGIPAHRAYLQPINSVPSCEDTTEILTGCSFLARTKLLIELSGFDEKYFCYVEDVDLSLRIKERGYRLGYTSKAVVSHKVSRSTGIRSPVMLYYKHRNMLYFLAKFQRPTSAKMLWWWVSLRYILSLTLKYREPKAALSLARGLAHAIYGRMGKL